MSDNGKGSAVRFVYSDEGRERYDKIFRKPAKLSDADMQLKEKYYDKWDKCLAIHEISKMRHNGKSKDS